MNSQKAYWDKLNARSNNQQDYFQFLSKNLFTGYGSFSAFKGNVRFFLGASIQFVSDVLHALSFIITLSVSLVLNIVTFDKKGVVDDASMMWKCLLNELTSALYFTGNVVLAGIMLITRSISSLLRSTSALASDKSGSAQWFDLASLRYSIFNLSYAPGTKTFSEYYSFRECITNVKASLEIPIIAAASIVQNACIAVGYVALIALNIAFLDFKHASTAFIHLVNSVCTMFLHAYEGLRDTLFSVIEIGTRSIATAMDPLLTCYSNCAIADSVSDVKEALLPG